MRLDLSLVVYKPNEDLLGVTMASMAKISAEFGRLYILVSGSNTDRNFVEAMVREYRLVEQVVMLHRFDNLGFASGHNLLLETAFEQGSENVLVINPDIEIEIGALLQLARAVSADGRFALYGPVIRQLGSVGARQLIDSAGIVWTRAGRHFDNLQGQPDFTADGKATTQPGVTGACLLVSYSAHKALIATSGYFFDDLFIAYREDAELGIRAGLAGIPSIVVNVGGFAHVRSVRGSKRGNSLPDLLGVRNRFLMKWRMGAYRPGISWIANLRDVIVIGGVLTKERTSLEGLKEAFNIRRYAAYTSPYLQIKPHGRPQGRLGESAH